MDHLDPVVRAIVIARREQKVTQAQLAELAGVSRRAIVMIEAGSDCSLSTLRRMTTALGMEIEARTFAPPTLDDVNRENEAAFRSGLARPRHN